jgi:hypothetical protein
LRGEGGCEGKVVELKDPVGWKDESVKFSSEIQSIEPATLILSLKTQSIYSARYVLLIWLSLSEIATERNHQA